MTRLERLGVDTIADILCMLPHRYEDRTEISPLGALRPGAKVLVEGTVELAEVAFRRKRSLLCRVADGSGSITLRFFHFSRYQQAHMKRGALLRCFGEVRAGPTGLEMIHPEYRILADDPEPPPATLTPVYPATEGLQQQRLRGLVEQALKLLEASPLEDYLADQLPRDGPSINAALATLHQPPQGSDPAVLATRRHPCQRRIALEELIAHRLSLRMAAETANRALAFPVADSSGVVGDFLASLPFELTRAQAAAVAEILADLRRSQPMHRLLQGDVGSGKTVVAAATMAAAAAVGYQVALMAPTELLAEQHAATLATWLAPLGIEMVALTGAVTGSARHSALGRIAAGTARVVVGTHALFQQSVRFRRLAYIVVDEQHRFGVRQRFDLMQKGGGENRAPHQLIMTATPIPRTLAMTAYADLDCSVIDMLPAGRQPVRTVVLPERRRAELIAKIGTHCRSGAQSYWVCPLIEESEVLESSAALEQEGKLAAALPELAVGLVHGRMRPQEKDEVMRRFKQGDIDLLVATTVVEVGVDVPTATLMIIENAERMGLAQLHQLRGRVGRGDLRSSCVLLYKQPLSELARERLRVMRETTDGFVIAQKDMELRGPGEVLGTRQTGALRLRVADLLDDADLLPQVVEISERLIEQYPERVGPLIRRWIKSGVEYAKV